jgi:hypothetical protein
VGRPRLSAYGSSLEAVRRLMKGVVKALTDAADLDGSGDHSNRSGLWCGSDGPRVDLGDPRSTRQEGDPDPRTSFGLFPSIGTHFSKLPAYLLHCRPSESDTS